MSVDVDNNDRPVYEFPNQMEDDYSDDDQELSSDSEDEDSGCESINYDDMYDENSHRPDRNIYEICKNDEWYQKWLKDEFSDDELWTESESESAN